jgi:hypothetical protein
VNGDRLEISRSYTGRGELGKGGPGQSEVRGGVGVVGVKKACLFSLSSFNDIEFSVKFYSVFPTLPVFILKFRIDIKSTV